MVKFEGTVVTAGSKDWTVPALSFGQLRRLASDIASLKSVDDVPTDEQIAGMMRVIHAALSRNYPELKLEEVEELIDLRNAPQFVQAIMGRSGLVRKEGDAAPGEPTAVS